MSYVDCKSIKIKFKLEINDVLYVNSIMDSYEGVGIVRTIDSSTGKVAVYTSDSMYQYALDVLESLRNEGLKIEDISVEETSDVDFY